MATGKGKHWHPTPTRNAWIPVGKLSSLKLRPVTAFKVNRIIKKFDPDAIGTLYISQRKDGSFWILDGNNRAEAIHRMWGPDSQVPCLIYTGLTPEQEANLFVEFNEDRTKPRPIDIFLAKLLAKDDVATAVAEIVVGKHGLEVTVAPGVARIAAVQSLTLLYEAASPQVLDSTLTLVSDAWGKHTDSYNTQILTGVGVILARYPEVDLTRLTKSLAATTPRRLLDRAREARCSEIEARSGDTKSGSYVARLILAGYNKRLRSDKVLVWVDQPSRYYWTTAAEYSRIALQKLMDEGAAE